jgi:hypothetical protein
VKAVALVVFALIPLHILGQGFLPPDDALRHAAKAVSGRDWAEILLLRPGTIDSHPGWHAVLGALRRATGAGTLDLVLFEVASMFFLFSLGPLLLLRRAEAWMVALMAVAVLEPLMVARLTVGRPLVLSMAVVVVLCLLWPRLDAEHPPAATLGAVAALLAAATWIHCSWYLFALPILAFVLAGRYRVAGRLLVATGAGVLLGALLTGMPFAFLWQSVHHPLLAFSGADAMALVREFQPYGGSPTLLVAVAVIVVVRKVWGGESARRLLADPVFVLAALGWVLGLRVARFWMDWGMPALLVFLALEIEAIWPDDEPSRRRLIVGIGLSVLSFLLLTSDVNGRWSHPPRDPAYRAMLAPEHAIALPDPGGILYCDDMRAFYDLFFLRPKAPWRYSTGYEPGLMPPADLAVYRAAVATRTIEAFEPWVRKMGPADRLVLHDELGTPPIAALEWHSVGYGLWSGRVRVAPAAAAATY